MPKKGQFDPTKWGTYICKYCGQEFKRRLSEVKFQQKNNISKEPQFCCRDHMLKFNAESVQSIEFTCKQCGKIFTRLRRQVVSAEHKNQPILFCSRKCKDEYRKKDRQEVTCFQCGKKYKQYVPKIKKKNFCSPECYHQYKESNLVEKECPVCKTKFYRTKGYIEKHARRGQNVIYCSIECRAFGNIMTKYGIADTDKTDFEFFLQHATCKYCNHHITFSTKKQAVKLFLQKQKDPSMDLFCTNRCRKQYLKNHASVTQVCKQCNKSFNVTQSEFNLGKIFCSTYCKDKYSHTNTNECHISSLRNTKEYLLWRKNVVQRDQFTCQQCGSCKNLQAHHIVPLKDICLKYANDFDTIRHSLEFNDISNGITLCFDCHSKIHPWMKDRKNNILDSLARPTSSEGSGLKGGEKLES